MLKKAKVTFGTLLAATWAALPSIWKPRKKRPSESLWYGQKQTVGFEVGSWNNAIVVSTRYGIS